MSEGSECHSADFTQEVSEHIRSGQHVPPPVPYGGCHPEVCSSPEPALAASHASVERGGTSPCRGTEQLPTLLLESVVNMTFSYVATIYSVV